MVTYCTKPNKKLVAYDALLIITVLSRVNSSDYECVQGIYAKKIVEGEETNHHWVLKIQYINLYIQENLMFFLGFIF